MKQIAAAFLAAAWVFLSLGCCCSSCLASIKPSTYTSTLTRRRSPALVLGLVHRDFSSASSIADGLAMAVHRSRSRLQRLQQHLVQESARVGHAKARGDDHLSRIDHHRFRIRGGQDKTSTGHVSRGSDTVAATLNASSSPITRAHDKRGDTSKSGDAEIPAIPTTPSSTVKRANGKEDTSKGDTKAAARSTKARARDPSSNVTSISIITANQRGEASKGETIASTNGDPPNFKGNDTRGRIRGTKNGTRGFIRGTKDVNATHQHNASPTLSGRTGFAASIVAGDGAFLTTFLLGTPPRNVTSIIDTGSDLVWQQCRPCQQCYTQPNPIFDPSLSSSYKPASCSDKMCHALSQSLCMDEQCQYQYMYGDSSYTRGELVYDTLTLMDEVGEARQMEGFAFGCGYDNVGNSFVGSDGLLGLGQGPLSLSSQISLEKFSYCLGSFMSSERSPLFLGDIASLEKNNHVQVMPMLTNSLLPTFYYIDLRGISIDGRMLPLPPSAFAIRSDGTGGMIIDSGTTLTYLDTESYETILEVVQARLRGFPHIPQPIFGLDLCYFALPLGIVPTLTFHFANANFNIPPTNLFINLGGISCLALNPSHGVSILGNLHQQNYHILYDRANNQISFTQTSCSNLLP